ncbi:hypothetical protein KIW84_044216 [Lathyrus oleraceus]|uniref:Uncharacterized protein n=1 Tax=Pisum sativum TaxID=3888 RepID=A0A9D4XHQ6_PEA|nr:hypothetical protein KIW84_044216 [Pisum sativum]
MIQSHFQEGLGRWSKTPGAAETSIKNLPPSAIGDPCNLDAMGLLSANKGRPMEGIVEQALQVGKRVAPESSVEPEVKAGETNRGVSGEPRASLTVAQGLAISTPPETVVVPFAVEANNLNGSMYYPDGESAKDLALELVENGFFKYVEWSANMMEEEAKWRLKTAELQAKSIKPK